jgi:hypothetical protein
MGGGPVHEKSFLLAIRVVKCSNFLQTDRLSVLQRAGV